MIRVIGSVSIVAGERSRRSIPGYRRPRPAREIHLLTGMYPTDPVSLGMAAAERAFGSLPGVQVRLVTKREL